MLPGCSAASLLGLHQLHRCTACYIAPMKPLILAVVIVHISVFCIHMSLYLTITTCFLLRLHILLDADFVDAVSVHLL